MLYVDVTEFGRIPDGGGHRFVGRQQGAANKLATPGLPRGKDYKPRTGTGFFHTVIDDHSRVAYVEEHNDEQAATAVGVLRRAVAFFADHGIRVEHRTLADGWAYARFYESEAERRRALPGWIHSYNHRRIHSAIGAPPISRLNNLPGHHS